MDTACHEPEINRKSTYILLWDVPDFRNRYLFKIIS